MRPNGVRARQNWAKTGAANSYPKTVATAVTKTKSEKKIADLMNNQQRKFIIEAGGKLFRFDL